MIMYTYTRNAFFVFRNSNFTTLNPEFIVEGCIAGAPTCFLLFVETVKFDKLGTKEKNLDKSPFDQKSAEQARVSNPPPRAIANKD